MFEPDPLQVDAETVVVPLRRSAISISASRCAASIFLKLLVF